MKSTLTKAELREQARLEAERKAAPLHLLYIINLTATQFLKGLDGGDTCEGVTLFPLELPPLQKKWCKEQLAKIIRWNVACMEKYGWDFSTNKKPSKWWESVQQKAELIGNAIMHYAPDATYAQHCIVQMSVAELAWRGVRVFQNDMSNEGKWLSQTLDTFVSRFMDEGDNVDWAATDVYMAIASILEGLEPYRKLDLETISAWSTIA